MWHCLVLLLTAQLVAVEANPLIKSHFEGHEQSEVLLRALSAVDVNDRNMQTWWGQFSVDWAEYDLMVKQDPTLYCLKPKELLAQLGTLKQKVELVITGLEAKEEQLRQIRAILEDIELGGKSGLHCEEDPDQPICKALDELDKKTADERVRVMAEMKLVTDEIEKVENYPCDCTYKEWAGNWGACSVTCEQGERKEARAILWDKRNGGKECDPKDATRTGVCNEGCCPVDCVWEDWSEWTACPEVLAPQPQFQNAFRSIKVEHECAERGGRACVGETKMSRKCNILSIKNEVIADKEKDIQALQDEIKGLKEGCHIKEK